MTINKGEGSRGNDESKPRSPVENGLADATAQKIRVPETVYRGLEAVRQSGLTNMLDRPVVAELAEELGFPETAHWVESNRKKYSEGVFRGFEVDYDGA